MLFVVIFLFLPVIGWYLGTGIYDAFTSTKPKKPTKDTYIIHNHYDNRQVHFHKPIPPEESHHLD